MADTYVRLASFAQTGGLVLFVLGFLAVLAYAFWPSRRRRKAFEDAARIPLKED